MKILVLNAGSGSHKSCLYDLGDRAEPPDAPPRPAWRAHIDWTSAEGSGRLSARAGDATVEIALPTGDRPAGMSAMLDTLVSGPTRVLDRLELIRIVGHRVVHGGEHFTGSVMVTPEVKAAIAELIPLAPDHNAHQLDGIESIERVLGAVPQAAVFDTAFHATLPPAARVYPIPIEWREWGIRRYGFHGISHQYVSRRAALLLGKPIGKLRMVTCHLGNGCSLAAVDGGRSVDTTMGYTPLEGLMMGDRSGSIDPGIVINLIRRHGLSADQVDSMLNDFSGLKGVSGLSSDMRTILAARAEGNERAGLALDIFVHRLCSGIGAMAASLGGLDALVFTAGIGENAPVVREMACARLAHLGVAIDRGRNAGCPPGAEVDVSAPGAAARTLVIPTAEDWAIARKCWRLLRERA